MAKSTPAAKTAAPEQTQIAKLVLANLNRPLERNTPTGMEKFRITRLSEKMGTLKDKSKAEFVIVTKADDENVTVSLHPNSVVKLFKDGSADNFTLLDPETTATGTEAAGDGTTDTTAAGGDAQQAAGGTEGGAAAPEPVKEAELTKEQKAAKKEEEKKQRAEKREADRLAARKAKEDKEEAEKQARLAAKGPDKKSRAIAIFNSVPLEVDGKKNENHRKTVIATLKKPEADGGLLMSGAGANTYYQNIKGGTWKKDAEAARKAAAATPPTAEEAKVE